MFDNNLLIVLNGYYYANELDDFNLNSLKSQSSKNFSILFIDPWVSDIRKNKIKEFQKETKIQSLYFPYQRDFRPRKYDWCTRNIASMILREGRFFNYWQNRIINKNTVKFIQEYNELNIGFGRIWLDEKYKYPFTIDEVIEYNNNGIYSAVLNSETCCFESNQELKIEKMNILFYSFYDACIRVDDFLKLNGTDEALTSWLYEEDWDIETRWLIASKLGLLHDVVASSPQMMYFGRGSRKYTNVQAVSSYNNYTNVQAVSSYNNYKKDGIHSRSCENCTKNSSNFYKQINIDNNKNIDGLDYIGLINNYIEWYKCKICGQLYPIVGPTGYEYVYNSAIKNNIYKASIGVSDNYGRNLAKIRKDVLSINKWEDKIEIINNSWKNQEYYQEN